jgi:hypothetical protein
MREWGWEGHVCIVPKMDGGRAAIAEGSLHTKATLNSQHVVTFSPTPAMSTGRTKACLGQNLLWNSELVEKCLLIGRQHYVYVSRQTERETSEHTLEQAYVELRGGKCQEDGELHCLSSASKPQRLKQGKISRVCSTNGRKEKFNRQFWWQIWTTLKSQA